MPACELCRWWQSGAWRVGAQNYCLDCLPDVLVSRFQTGEPRYNFEVEFDD